MWLMLQQDKPDDYVIATGETHFVKEFLEEAFSYMDLDWQNYVEFDAKYARPAEVDVLLATLRQRACLLGQPKVKFKQLVRLMVDADIATVDSKEHEVFGDTDSSSTLSSARF